MVTTIVAVLGTETNPLMSGIAKFNAQLARRLGVPYQRVSDQSVPLVSIRSTDDWGRLIAAPCPPYDLFLHQAIGHDPRVVVGARRVFAAQATLAEEIRPLRPDVIAAWCPGLIEHRGAFPASDITVFSFGMGHKIRQQALYVRLKTLIEATGRTYTLYLSSGLHAGHGAGDQGHVDLEALFGDHVIFLGILSDRATAHYLATSTFVVQFFDHGVRENNTTVLAALDAGACVITNVDAGTPPALAARVIDVLQVRAGAAIARRPLRLPPQTHGYAWDRLVSLLQEDG